MTLATMLSVREALLDRSVSVGDVVGGCLQSISQRNKALRAFITVLGPTARAAADGADSTQPRGQEKPLHGVPFAAKDLIETERIRTTAGSKVLADWYPDRDADVIKRLHRAGAILIGKTNLTEFGCGVTGRNGHYGDARNPWDPNRIAGGSSSGSAIAVATGAAYFALGTDTGGSVRVPAALCGVTGYKPTYGLVPTQGVVPLSWSLDHVGIIAPTAADVLAVLAVLAPLVTSPTPPPRVEGLKLGLLDELWEPARPSVSAAANAAVERLVAMGAVRVRLSLPVLAAANAATTVISATESADVHSRWLDEAADKYLPATLHRLRLGQLMRGVDYVRAQRVRSEIADGIEDALRSADFFISPTCPITAPRFVDLGGPEDETTASGLPQFTRVFNLTGGPAISVPCGQDDEGMPVGLQIAGGVGDDLEVLRLAATLQRETHWHRAPPRALSAY